MRTKLTALVGSVLLGDPYVDACHPTDAGHYALARAILPAALKLLKPLGSKSDSR